MNYAEQIKQWEATRAAKAAERASMMTKSLENGQTLDAEQTITYDGLTTELKNIDAHLSRLRDLEADAVANATSISTVVETGKAAEMRGGVTPNSNGGARVIGVANKDLPPGIAFARYVLVQARAFKLKVAPEIMAKQMYPEMTKMHGMIRDAANFGGINNVMKAAVAAGNTTDATWAGPLLAYNDFAGDFINYLRPQTIIGKFGTTVNGVAIPSLRSIPFNIHIKGQTSGGTGYWVGEGQPKPLTKFDFSDVLLRWFKCAGITVVTEEMLRFSNAGVEAMLRDALRDAIVETLDISFANPAFAGGAASPASIFNGVTPITASGVTAADLRQDLNALWGPWDTTNIDTTNAVYLMDSKTARMIASMRTNLESSAEFPQMSARGGSLDGVPVIVSNYVPRNSAGGTIELLSADDVYLADDGEVTIDSSTEASLQMDTAPTNASSPTATSTTLVSMFQTDSVAMRAERYINWAKRRPAAAQLLRGANYGA